MNPFELQIVVSNMMVASLIGMLAWLVGRSGSRAQLAHLLWVALFVKLVTPPLVLLPVAVPASWAPMVTFAQPTMDISSDNAVNSAETASASFNVVPTMVEGSGELAAPGVSVLTLWQLVAVTWVGGFAWLLARGFLRFLRFQRLLKNEGRRDDEGTQFAAALIQAVNVKCRSTPDVLRVPVRVSPMLFGFGHRPVIVCPDALWTLLSVPERHAFLAHEVAHFCRRDHWVRWLEWLVAAIYWWFPLVYLARRQLERHEEACCDAWAVRQLNSPPRRYAETLLKVVDFISDHQVGIPQLASAMQPTGCLEERLRFVMQGGAARPTSGVTQSAAIVVCVTLLLLHPIPQPVVNAGVAVSFADSSTPVDSVQQDSESAEGNLNEPPAPELPPPPQGFWNRRPQPKWADFSLSLPGAQLTATAGHGVMIELINGERLSFTSDELRAIADIPATQRVVIGQADGRVRLWDLTAGVPVSLLGQHAAAVTSMAWHEQTGLISADEAGSVIRWDMQSGQVLATTTIPDASVQSVRFSGDGTEVAILSGRWDQISQPQQVVFADSVTLQPVTSLLLRHSVAVVLPSQSGAWLSIDWHGNVWTLETDEWQARISKEAVSALSLVTGDAVFDIHANEEKLR
ncbi:MAG: M56 family metallopeptidase [Planctomycetaceae bacterium]